MFFKKNAAKKQQPVYDMVALEKNLANAKKLNSDMYTLAGSFITATNNMNTTANKKRM